MRDAPRARRLFERFNPAFCITGGLLALYLGRVAALYVLARCFAGMGLNSETYSTAPAWLRALADLADTLASSIGLALGCCTVIILKSGKTSIGRIKPRQWLFMPYGIAAGIGFVALLRALDEIRFLPGRFTIDWIGCILWLCLSAFMALCLRGAFDVKAKLSVALTVSMVLQPLFAWYLMGSLDLMLTLNALLYGCVSVLIYPSACSVLPEILLFYGYTLGHRVLSGYPAGRGFYVSANVLSGADAGLFASILTTVPLALMIAVLLPREMKHQKKSRGKLD